MNLFRAASLMVLFAGCRPGPPKLQPDCTFHEDCRVTTVASSCCDACEARPGNVKSIDALFAWCVDHPPAGCPKLDCAANEVTAMCEKGRCVAKAGIHRL